MLLLTVDLDMTFPWFFATQRAWWTEVTICWVVMVYSFTCICNRSCHGRTTHLFHVVKKCQMHTGIVFLCYISIFFGHPSGALKGIRARWQGQSQKSLEQFQGALRLKNCNKSAGTKGIVVVPEHVAFVDGRPTHVCERNACHSRSKNFKPAPSRNPAKPVPRWGNNLQKYCQHEVADNTIFRVGHASTIARSLPMKYGVVKFCTEWFSLEKVFRQMFDQLLGCPVS